MFDVVPGAKLEKNFRWANPNIIPIENIKDNEKFINIVENTSNLRNKSISIKHYFSCVLRYFQELNSSLST